MRFFFGLDQSLSGVGRIQALDLASSQLGLDLGVGRGSRYSPQPSAPFESQSGLPSSPDPHPPHARESPSSIQILLTFMSGSGHLQFSTSKPPPSRTVRGLTNFAQPAWAPGCGARHSPAGWIDCVPARSRPAPLGARPRSIPPLPFIVELFGGFGGVFGSDRSRAAGSSKGVCW